MGQQDKTALGKVVSHAPTNLQPHGEPDRQGPHTAQKKGKESHLPPSPEKTVLGRAVSHQPTTLSPTTRAGKDKPAQPGHANPQPSPADHYSPPPAPHGNRALTAAALAFSFLVLVLLTAGIVGFGIYFFSFRDAQQAPDSPGANLAHVTQPESASPTSPDSKQDPTTKKAGGPSPKKPPGSQKDNPPTYKSDDFSLNKDKQPGSKTDEPSSPKKLEPDPLDKTEPKSKDAKKPDNEPVKPNPEKDALPAVSNHLQKLMGGTLEEQIKAVEQLAALGEQARPATQALCIAALSPVKGLSRAALKALEQVAPELSEPIFLLVVDGQAANHLKAIATLRKLGVKAKPAAPVLLDELQKRQAVFQLTIIKGANSGWNSHSLEEVIDAHMTALALLVPDEPLVVRAIIGVTTMSFRDAPFKSPRGFEPFRSSGLKLLYELAEKQPEHRKQIIIGLVYLFNDSVEHVKTQRQLTEDINELESVMLLLLRFSSEAQEPLAKIVIPQLHDLVRLPTPKLQAVRTTVRPPLLNLLVQTCNAPEHRKQVILGLVQPLADAVERTKAPPSKGVDSLLREFAEVDSISLALLQCGSEARAPVEKVVFPLLKDLEFHTDQSVRLKAKTLLQAFQEKKSPSTPQIAVNAASPTSGSLGQARSKSYRVTLVAGKTYVIDAVSGDFDPYLYLQDSFGRPVAQFNGRIVFRCTIAGEFEIIVAPLNPSHSGAFTLAVKEQ
jgi:hypothetical protein